MPRRRREAMPAWLKLYTDTREMILAAPSDSLGDAVKGLYRLLTEPEYRGEDLSMPALLLFLQLRRGTDESVSDYQYAVACGKRGGDIRWSRAAAEETPAEGETLPGCWEGIAPGYFPIWEGMSPTLREAYTRLNEFQQRLDETDAQAP